MGKGGKSKGKIAFSLIGFAVGSWGASLGWFGNLSASTGWLIGGMYGASIASTLWSVTQKPNQFGNMDSDYSQDDYSRFNTVTNDINQNAVIPVIYGNRKYGGLQSYHNPYNGSRYLEKHVIICEAGVQDVYDVMANEELIKDDTNISIYNIQHQDATVHRSGNTLVLNAGGTKQEYALGDTDHYDAQSSLLSTVIDKIKAEAGNGWKIDGAVDDRTSKGISANSMQFNKSTPVPCYCDPTDTHRENMVVLDDRGYKIGTYEFHQNEVPENYLEVGGYPQLAWIKADLTASSRLSGSNPTINCLVHGMKVKVWKNNKWETEYSENPAWIIRDFLISKRYGTGQWISEDMLDDESFKEVAAYCDEEIEYLDFDGSVKTAKRYKLNIILDTAKTPIDHLSSMLAVFGGFITFGKQIALKVEKAETPVYDFDDTTIVKDSVSIGQTALEDTPNRYKIGYFDPNQNWTEVKVVVEDLELQEEQGGKITEKTVSLAGCTSQNQALRLGRLYRDLNKVCSLTISFSVATQGMMLECGDVVTVTYGGIFTKMPFRITQIEETNEGVYSLTCRQYNESIYNDTLGAQIVNPNYVNVGSTITNGVPSPENLVLAEDSYINKDGSINCNLVASWDDISSVYLRSYQVSISTDGINYESVASTYDNKIRITNLKIGSKYYVAVQAIDGNGLNSPAVIGSITLVGKNMPPDAVTGLAVTTYADKKGYVTAKWNANSEPDFSHYEVTIDGVTYKVFDNNFSIQLENSGIYSIEVVAVDNSGNKSIPTIKSINVNCEPENVPSIDFSQKYTDRTILQIEWQAVSDMDIDCYELRINNSADWDSGKVITKVKSLTYEYEVTESNQYTIMVKAINTNGFYSKGIAMRTKQVALEPDAVTNFRITQQEKDRSEFLLSWEAPYGGDIKGYIIRISSPNRSLDAQYFTAQNTYTWTAPDSGEYSISVSAVTIAGFTGRATTILQQCNIDPADITGLKAVQSKEEKSMITLSWDSADTLDIVGYEVRQGASWDSGKVITSKTVNNEIVIQIDSEEKYTWWVAAISKAGKISQYPQSISGVFSLRPSTPTNLELIQDQSDSSLFTLSFDAISDVDLQYYEIRLGFTWEEGIVLVKTQTTTFQFRPTDTSQMIKIMVKAKNTSGYYSDEAWKTMYAVLEPAAVQGFYAYQNGEYVQFMWNPAETADVQGYEIREGQSFDDGSLIGTNITGITYSTGVDFNGEYHYHIKAINRIGKYSIDAASSVVNVTNLPDKNVILTVDELELKNGIHNDTEFNKSSFNFSNLPGRFSDYPTLRFDDVGGGRVLKLKQKADGTYPATGTYLCQVIDLGTQLSAKISIRFRKTSVLNSKVSAKLQVRYSLDNVTWTEWRDFTPTEYTTRYIELRVILGTSDIKSTPEVNRLIVYIDMPDVEKTGSAVVPIGGTLVEYDKPFYIVPVTVATAIGKDIRCQITQPKKESFYVQVINAVTGADVGGNVDWRSKAY